MYINSLQWPTTVANNRDYSSCGIINVSETAKEERRKDYNFSCSLVEIKVATR